MIRVKSILIICLALTLAMAGACGGGSSGGGGTTGATYTVADLKGTWAYISGDATAGSITFDAQGIVIKFQYSACANPTAVTFSVNVVVTKEGSVTGKGNIWCNATPNQKKTATLKLTLTSTTAMQGNWVVDGQPFTLTMIKQ